jgi:hypothetical protein
VHDELRWALNYGVGWPRAGATPRRGPETFEGSSGTDSMCLILSYPFLSDYHFLSKLALRKSAGRSISEIVFQEAEEAKVILQLKSPALRLPDHKVLRWWWIQP